MSSEELHKMALHDTHVAMEATMGEEGGWSVPLSYTGALAEVDEVRSRAGVMDLSHVGRIRIRGDEMLDLMMRVCTHDIAHQEDDTVAPSLLLNEKGGILSDCRVLRMEDDWMILCEAGNREKVLKHLTSVAEGLDVKITDRTDKTVMIGIVGRKADEILRAALPEDPTTMPADGLKVNSLMLAKYIALKADFGCLWGLEVILPKLFAGKAWRYITEKAGDKSIAPVGMTAREILRIEAGVPRYGYELNETVDPITAGLERLVDSNHDFIGKQALVALKDRSPARRLVGMVLSPDTETDGVPPVGMIPTRGMSVYRDDGLEVGVVTSGTFSARLEAPIALAYVASESADVGTSLHVEVTSQSQPIASQVVQVPFVKALA